MRARGDDGITEKVFADLTAQSGFEWRERRQRRVEPVSGIRYVIYCIHCGACSIAHMPDLAGSSE